MSVHIVRNEPLVQKEIAIISDLTQAMNMATEGPIDLEHFSEELRDNEMLVKRAVRDNGRNLKYASERLRDDEEIVYTASDPGNSPIRYSLGKVDAIQYASYRLRDDLIFMSVIVGRNHNAINYATPRLKSNSHLVLIAEKSKKLLPINKYY